jgi:hypothetical protein
LIGINETTRRDLRRADAAGLASRELALPKLKLKLAQASAQRGR